MLVYRGLRSYHKKLMARNVYFKRSEVDSVNEADRKVLKFFALICQFLIVWSGYMLTQIISRLNGGLQTVWGQRMVQLMSVCLSVSSIFMLYGISDSIKQALRTQQEQDRI